MDEVPSARLGFSSTRQERGRPSLSISSACATRRSRVSVRLASETQVQYRLLAQQIS